jgi:hypothetical protein
MPASRRWSSRRCAEALAPFPLIAARPCCTTAATALPVRPKTSGTRGETALPYSMKRSATARTLALLLMRELSAQFSKEARHELLSPGEQPGVEAQHYDLIAELALDQVENRRLAGPPRAHQRQYESGFGRRLQNLRNDELGKRRAAEPVLRDTADGCVSVKTGHVSSVTWGWAVCHRKGPWLSASVLRTVHGYPGRVGRSGTLPSRVHEPVPGRQ